MPRAGPSRRHDQLVDRPDDRERFASQDERGLVADTGLDPMCDPFESEGLREPCPLHGALVNASTNKFVDARGARTGVRSQTTDRSIPHPLAGTRWLNPFMLTLPIERPTRATHFSPQPYSPPPFDHLEARVRQTFAQGLQWNIEDPGSDWAAFELSLLKTDDSLGASPIYSATEALYRLHTPHGAFELQTDTLILLTCGISLPPDSSDPQRRGLLKIALAHAPLPLIAALGGAIELSDASRAGQDSGMDVARGAVLTLVGRDGTRHSLQLRASASTLLGWVSEGGWRALPPPPPSPPITSIGLVCGLHVGRERLPLSSIRSLRHGDAIWIPSATGDGHASLCLIAGSQIVHLGQVDSFSCEFQGWGPLGVANSNRHQAFPPSTEPRNVDALTVDLDFIVGRLSMTVGELSALSKGQIVPLDGLTPAQVRIVAHGTELGRGHLVEIEGRLAVEIDEWSASR